MEETDIIICLKKRNKDYQKNYRKAKNKHNFVFVFFLLFIV